MRLVHIHGGVLQIRWTWLPFWVAVQPATMSALEQALKDRVLLGGVTDSEEDLEAMHAFVVRWLERRFPAFGGLRHYLEAVSAVGEAPEGA